jgi:AraC-like DNA-binding protein
MPMNENPPSVIRFRDITEMHAFLNLDESIDPLISLNDLASYGDEYKRFKNQRYELNFYGIHLIQAEMDGIFKYSKTVLEVKPNEMSFVVPERAVLFDPLDITVNRKGFALYISKDLIINTHLAKKIHEYPFFAYNFLDTLKPDSNQLNQIIHYFKIIKFHISNKHTHLLINCLELFFDFLNTIYNQGKNMQILENEIFLNFKQSLVDYYLSGKSKINGLPRVSYFCEELNISEQKLRSEIKSEENKNPTQYIQEHIFYVSKNKLLSTDKSIKQISFELGFQNPAAFTKFFKKCAKVSPIIYRIENR